jgi:hypothetical protein
MHLNPALRGSVTGSTGAVSETNTAVVENRDALPDAGNPVAPHAAALVMATVPQALSHAMAEIPTTALSSLPPDARPALNSKAPLVLPFPDTPPASVHLGMPATSATTGSAFSAVTSKSSGAATHVMSTHPQALANPRTDMPGLPPTRPSSLPPDVPANVLAQLQIKPNVPVAAVDLQAPLPPKGSDSNERPLWRSKPSSSAKPGETGKPHTWQFKSEKSGGAHGAGDKGGIHVLVNDKSECIDLKEKKLNVLNDKDQAKDLSGKTITVTRNKEGEIDGVRYEGAGILSVIHATNGELIHAGGEVIAKLDNPQMALVKNEPNVAKNMTEFIGSVLFRSRHPDLFPEVHLTDTSSGGIRTGADIYAVSIYIEGYTCDLFKDIFKQNGDKVPESKPHGLGITEGSQEYIRKAFAKGKYENFAKVTVPALRGDEFDMHTGNLGLKGEKQLVRIDLAGSLRKICKHPTLRPHSQTEHPLGFGPTNRFAQYHDSLKHNAAFVHELDADVEHDYATPISTAFADLVEFYDIDSFKGLAKWVGLSASELPKTDDCKAMSAFISQKVEEAYSERGRDMSRFSAQIKTDMCIEKNPKGGWLFKGYTDVDGKSVSFSNVVLKHQDYFADVLCGTAKFKLRDQAHAADKGLAKTTIEVVQIVFAKEILRDPNLKGALQLLSRFSKKQITTPEIAYEALGGCSKDQRRQVLDAMSNLRPLPSSQGVALS